MADQHSIQRVALDLALARLQEQTSYRSTLDTRVGQSFALGAAMIALMGSALLIADQDLRDSVRGGFSVAAGLFIASIVTSTCAYVMSRWRTAPSSADLLLTLTIDEEDELQVLRDMTVTILTVIDQNEPWLRAKAALVNTSIVLTAATAISIVASALTAL